LWYFCAIGEDTNTSFDLMKFIYFRSSRCNAEFQWKYLNLTDVTVTVETTSESYYSQKTLTVAIVYLLVNFALIVTAIAAICKCGESRERNEV
jgi:hypothetical protein